MLELKDVCVKSTTDYGKFKTLIGNREVNDFNVKKIVASMNKQQLASIAIVNEKNEIIDGAHRKRACEELGLPFNYIVIPGYGIKEVHILNTNMKNWNNEDFVRQFSDRFMHGEKSFGDYKVLVDYMDDFSLKMGKAMALLQDGKPSGSETLREGLFEIQSDLDLADENRNELSNLESELGANITSTVFWQAYVLSKRVEGFTFQTFFTKVKRFRQELESTKNKVEYMLETFEDAYNDRNRKPIPLKFEAFNIFKESRR